MAAIAVRLPRPDKEALGTALGTISESCPPISARYLSEVLFHYAFITIFIA